jgi:hypothetical protein
MKALLNLTLGVIALQPACFAAQFYMAVVAEQAHPSAKIALPTPDHPTYYVAYDAGYIEEGDPIAGEMPPAAAEVAQVLHGTLASKNYLPATAQSMPSVLFIYHWGRLSHDSMQIRSSFRLEPNLKARLVLIATTKQAGEIGNYLMNRRMGVTDPAFRVPGFLGIQERDVLDLARDDRYFVIVSAYDYNAFTRREAKLLWRAKMSTRSPGVAMADALPALLREGGSYFGRNLDETQTVRAPLLPEGRVGVGTPKVEEFLPPPEVTKQLDEHHLRGFMHQEHVEFSGVLFSDAPKDKEPPPPIRPSQ